ncbi:MAG TPA: hypothetical protein VFA16_22410 [Mycobacterium sp.]|uniref:hypothetical protein n=1 Tax=Mycobacterium sp. TaxID=1785 RepID=UPI002D638EF5|nr:hypothetical protein [Mycobacterium sp.]HZU49980.1 hypothetical protein [Mycobacterium sp.]
MQPVEPFPQFSAAIATPEHIHGARSLDAYRDLAVQVGRQTQRFYALTVSGQTLPAFVNGGRWLVRCVCANCPSAHPRWNRAICLECGREWTAAFPETWPQIEACLRARPVVNRNWQWHETLTELEQENAEHDLPLRAAN